MLKKIIKVRKQLGYSQKLLSQALSLSQSQYSKRETGKIQFSLREIGIVCKLLNLDLKITLIGLISKSSKVGFKSSNSSDIDQEILDALNSITRESRSILDQSVKETPLLNT